MTRTRRAIHRLAAGCPNSRVALVGFSQGAQVVHQLAATLDTSERERIALVAMIADPLRDPDDTIGSWTYGTDATDAGTAGAGPRLGEAYGRSAITFCTAGDEICSWPAQGHDGPLSTTHREFYERPEHARATGLRMAAVLRRSGL